MLHHPDNCSETEWKTYFCGLSQQVLDQNHIAYTINCSAVSDAGGEPPLPKGVECASIAKTLTDLETQVRGQAWQQYSSSAAGCAGSNLVERISAWCDGVVNQVMADAPICQ